jgi:hypothetical protein
MSPRDGDVYLTIISSLGIRLYVHELFCVYAHIFSNNNIFVKD